MKLENVIADLHVHGFTSPETGFGDFLLKPFGPGKRTITSFIEYSRRKVGAKNTVVGVVNFDNNTYEIIANSRKRLSISQIYDDHRKVFVGVNRVGKWFLLIRGQEIHTDIGHVLVLVGDSNIKYRKFEDVHKAAKDMGALLVADHVLGTFGLGAENLRKYKEFFSGVEAANSIFPELTEKTERLLSEPDFAGLARYYNSDSHSLRTIFSSYTLFDVLDISNPCSLKDGLRKSIKGQAGKNRIGEKYIHAVSVAYNLGRFIIGDKLRFVPGLLRRQETEIE